MTFKHTISLAVDVDQIVDLTVSFTEHDDTPDELRVEVRRSSGGALEAEAVWHVRDHNGTFSLEITTQTIASGICLAGCLAGIVSGAGPLVDCLKKAKNRADVRKCINLNAVAQAVSALSCIYACLNIP